MKVAGRDLALEAVAAQRGADLEGALRSVLDWARPRSALTRGPGETTNPVVNLRPGARPLAVFFLGSFLASAACGGPPVPSPIDGEPITPISRSARRARTCAGAFALPGHADGARGQGPITRTTLTGRRSKDDPPSRILLSDRTPSTRSSGPQCENRRAPRTRVVARVEGRRRVRVRQRDRVQDRQARHPEGDAASLRSTSRRPRADAGRASSASAPPPAPPRHPTGAAGRGRRGRPRASRR